jgi:hypothetical protein
VLPLNGTKTHPLTDHARKVLRDLSSGPLPRQALNPGVINRLLREDLIECRMGPSPYKTKPGEREYAHITDAGRAALEQGGQS